MKLLILGKTGQLGSELATQAARLKLDVTALGSVDLEVTDRPAVWNWTPPK